MQWYAYHYMTDLSESLRSTCSKRKMSTAYPSLNSQAMITLNCTPARSAALNRRMPIVSACLQSFEHAPPRPRAGSLRTVPRAGAQAPAERCPVIDYMLLCSKNDGLSQEDLYQSFSEVLSLMYMVPNILIGFTGPVRWQSDSGDGARFDHALHFRLADRASAQAFMSSSTKLDVFKNHLEPASESYTEVLFTGTVMKDMDSMFRRSDQWAVGAEHVAFLSHNAACPSDDPDVQLGEYTQLLTQVAESPVAGAIQSMAGPVIGKPAPEVAEGATRQMLMSRFLTVEEAQAFTQLPPCDALRHGDSRCPGLAVSEFIFEIEPVQGSEGAAAL